MSKTSPTNSFIVKEVRSGDTLTLLIPNSMPPKEKIVTLANIEVPKMARKAGMPAIDEPYAFDAREFLRRKLIGKNVTFEFEYHIEKMDRDFGQVFLGSECLSQALVEAGLATVRLPRGQSNDLIAALQATEELAKHNEQGLHSEDEESKHVRQISWEPADDGEKDALFQRLQGKTIKAVVEQVVTAAQLRVYIPDLEQMALVAFLGVQLPDKVDGTIPFGDESKFVVELALLNREVSMKIESCVANGILLLGSVVAGDNCYSTQLLSKGYAKLHSSASRSIYYGQLQAAQESAVKAKLRIWKNTTPQVVTSKETSQPTTAKLSDEDKVPFDAQVLHIINGDTIEVVSQGNIIKLSFANTKAPKPTFAPSQASTKTSEYPEYSWDSREFLRKLIIGKTVRVQPCYRRPIGAVNEDGPESRESKKAKEEKLKTLEHRLCCCVYTTDGSNTNVAAALIEQGLAVLPQGRTNDAPDLEELQTAQVLASRRSKFMDLNSPAATTTFQDLFRPGQKKAQQYLTFLRGTAHVAPKHKCIIEQVISASRYRVCVPSNACIITLVVSGLNAPSNGRKDSEGRVLEDPQPFGPESTDFAKRNFWQRDAEVEIESTDPNGIFYGALTVDKELIGETLLKAGMVTLNQNAERSGKYYSNYHQAENYGIRNSLGVFSLPEEARPGEYMSKARKSRMASGASGRTCFDNDQACMPCMVTEVSNGTQLWVQLLTDENKQTLRAVNSLLQSVQLNTGSHKNGIRNEDLVVARFSQDNVLYRAKVQRVINKGEKFTVTYIDYGNTETITKERIWKVPEVTADFQKNPQLAVPLSLAFLADPEGDEIITETKYVIQDYVNSMGPLFAQVLYREEGKRNTYVIVKPQNASKGASLQSVLLKEGVCRLKHRFLPGGSVAKRDPEAYSRVRQVLRPLEEAETEAKRNHKCIWVHGDCFESDED